LHLFEDFLGRKSSKKCNFRPRKSSKSSRDPISSQCTSVIQLEILDTGVRQVMRLDGGQALQSLRLTNNRIAELQMEDFQALTKLRVLDLARNKLVRIPSRVFTNSRRLSRLCLARNIISFITRQSFLGRIIITS
jgi:Leucine-rich repeat (LRR) protein